MLGNLIEIVLIRITQHPQLIKHFTKVSLLSLQYSRCNSRSAFLLQSELSTIIMGHFLRKESEISPRFRITQRVRWNVAAFAKSILSRIKWPNNNRRICNWNFTLQSNACSTERSFLTSALQQRWWHFRIKLCDIDGHVWSLQTTENIIPSHVVVASELELQHNQSGGRISERMIWWCCTHHSLSHYGDEISRIIIRCLSF